MKLLTPGNKSVLTNRDKKFQNFIADVAHTYALDVGKANKGTEDEINKKIAIQGQICSLNRQRSSIPVIPAKEAGLIIRNGSSQANIVIDFETYCALVSIQKDMGSRGVT